MFRKIDDFVSDWTQDSAGTLKVMQALTDESLRQRVTPEGRTLGRLAWHVAETIPEMLGHAGITVAGPGPRNDTPETAAEIAGAYERAARAVPAAVRAAWTDDDLDDYVEMYGQRWKKGTVLSALQLHEAHHRGQMTVLMRQAGLKVPGCYGPAAEEWAAMGMAAMS
jgi:uncharacterized damage-inducible protein DinB